MPQRDDSSEIRHILFTTTTTSYSKGTSSFARWQRQRRQRQRWERKRWKGKIKIPFLRQKEPMHLRLQGQPKVTLCMKYNAGDCKRDNCYFTHAFSHRLPSGRPCMQSHSARNHRSSTVNTRQSTELPTEQHSHISFSPIPDSSHSIELGTIPTDKNNIMPTSDSVSSSHQIFTPLQTTQLRQRNQDSTITVPTQVTQPTRLFLIYLQDTQHHYHVFSTLRSHWSYLVSSTMSTVFFPTQERWWSSSSSIQGFLRRTSIGYSCPATTSSGI